MANGQMIGPAGDVVVKERAWPPRAPPPIPGMVVDVPDELPELGMAGMVVAVAPVMAGMVVDDEDGLIGAMELGELDPPMLAIDPLGGDAAAPDIGAIAVLLATAGLPLAAMGAMAAR
jgi:hypothetical protein